MPRSRTEEEPRSRRSRRQQYSAATRQALVDEATRLFTEQGYGATSLDAVVAAAEVTKGALYHHFAGKAAVFAEAFDAVETRAAERITAALDAEDDPWDKARAGLAAFLTVVQEPEYRRIVVQDGPAVLGYERFRESEERSTFACVTDIVRAVLSSERGLQASWAEDEEMLATFARIFFGALSSAGEAVTTSADPEAAAGRVEAAIGLIIAGLQALVDDEDTRG
ncbi:TetR/AcrR family transcriptional regulator [Nocardioides bruguierae]|uniref:TetR/AcrR family transcriptional regulator n=1 Tax=Nocardioides bruguierae TaxID=2945102 RepID=A0A9X2D7B1_9ACTN|nr:TetR family transcriptional regulator [Nocardioides bruguierae]MCL8025623.1 TetR/AcrR family transcriptional regulator [Nocardioides bruguierae]MCM0620480.1 TetR/AcrR family transcriptional regulator [Nocardioides bruguierae]